MGFNDKLIADVERLKALRVIKKDVDISVRTGYNKSTVSNYISNRMKASPAFLEAFYAEFKEELSENKVLKQEAKTVNTLNSPSEQITARFIAAYTYLEQNGFIKSQLEFAESLGWHKVALNFTLNEGRNHRDVPLDICIKFTEPDRYFYKEGDKVAISRQWLLEGIGEMFARTQQFPPDYYEVRYDTLMAELNAKDEIIKELRERLSDKDEIIALQKKQQLVSPQIVKTTKTND